VSVAVNEPLAPTPATAGFGTSWLTVSDAEKYVVVAGVGLDVVVIGVGIGVGVGAGAGGSDGPPLDEK
jgi:hypothetical protein